MMDNDRESTAAAILQMKSVYWKTSEMYWWRMIEDATYTVQNDGRSDEPLSHSFLSIESLAAGCGTGRIFVVHFLQRIDEFILFLVELPHTAAHSTEMFAIA